MTRLLIVLLCGLLAGCAVFQDIVQEPPFRRAERARAEILELYRDCLRRQRVDPKVDCSDFRTAIEIRRER